MQTATEDADFSFVVPANTFADQDAGDTLAYEASGLPGWLNFNAATAEFTGTPRNGDVSSSTITLKATDAAGLTATTTFTLKVENTNDAPTVANPIADQSATEDLPFSLTFDTNTFADVDAGDTLTYTATKADGTTLPGWLNFDAANRTFSGTPGNGDVGPLDITVTATDGSTTSASDTFRIMVASVNDTPTISAISPQTVDEDGTLLALPFQVSDEETAASWLSVSATSSNAALVPDNSASLVLAGSGTNRTLTVKPAANVFGTVTISVTVGDGNSSVTRSFDLTINPVNDAPEASGNSTLASVSEDEAAPPGAQVATLFGARYSDSADAALATDMAGVAITGNSATAAQGTWQYSADGQGGWTAIPTSGLSNEAAVVLPAAYWLRFVPAANFNGTPGALTVRLADGSQGPVLPSVGSNLQDVTGGTGAWSAATVSLSTSITAVNDRPTISPPFTDLSVQEDFTRLLLFTVADLETDADSLTVTATSSDTSIIQVPTVGGSSSSRWIQLRGASQAFGTATVTVNVNDGTETNSSTFTVTVDPVNDAPLLLNGNNRATLPGVAEDAASPAGAPLSLLLAGNYDDSRDRSMATPLTAVAVIGNSAYAEEGQWQYSADGSTGWTTIPAGGPSDQAAVVLPATYWMRFLPAADFNGQPGELRLRLGDGSTGPVAYSPAQNIEGARGGTNMWSSSTVYLGTDIAAVNDAPALVAQPADRTVDEDAALTLTFPEFPFADVEDGYSLTYTATRADGSPLPAWLSFDAQNLIFSGTPTNGDVGSVTILLTARDSANAEGSCTFTLTVANTNDAPTVANLIADQSATEEQAFSFTFAANTFADVDAPYGDTLTYSATKADGTALPSWLTFDTATRTFSGTPTNDDVGLLDITVTASDIAGAPVSDTFRITVGNVNDAPTLANPIADQGATEDQAFSFVVPVDTFADVDAGDTLTYTATKADGSALPAWLTFNASTRTFSGTPANGDVGFFDVKVTARDGSNVPVTDEFRITVANTNDAPTVATAIADQDATQGQAFTFTVAGNTFADVDALYGDTLTYSATKADGTALPSWLTFDATTLTFSGTPTNGDVGFFDVKVTARDGSNVPVTDEFRITVANANDAPTVASAIPDQGATEDQAFTFVLPTNTFADVDAPYGDTLAYTATKTDGSPLPAWLTFDAATRTFSGTPANGDVGQFEVKVTATDGSGVSVFDEFRITVANTNDAPTVAGPIADQAATEDLAFSFVVPADTFADVDTPYGDTLTYTATKADGTALPSWLTFNAANRTFSGTPVNDDVGAVDITVTATDGSNTSASDTFRVTVSNVNDAPTLASAITDQSATEDQAFSFVVPANTFADVDAPYGDTLAYTATKADGSALPAWLTFNAATRTFSGTPANGDVGFFDIQVTATDASGVPVSDEFRVTVANTNDAPTLANPISDQSATEDEAFTFVVPANTFADVDVPYGDTATYTATKADGSALPAWLTFNATTRTFSGTPANGDVGFIDIQVTATDGSGVPVTDEFRITVANTNDAPALANPIADQGATEDQAFAFTFNANTFADVDAPYGDTLTYTAMKADGTALPSWLTFNAATRTFSGTPANGDVGFFDVKVTATDGSGVPVTDKFRITVTNTNDAPAVAASIADQRATEDEEFDFEVPRSTFADVDAGDRLSVTATLADGSDLPEWLKFDEDDLEFSGTPRNADVGTLQIRLTATDRSGATVSDVFALTVTNTNDAPTRANPIADQSATEDQAFSFVVPAGTFADVDVGDTLAYTATKADGSALPAWLTFNAATRTFSGTPANGDVGRLDIKVTASDGSGVPVSDEFRITVANVNDAPTLVHSIADQTATEDQAFSFEVPRSTFADVDAGDRLSVTATLADGSDLPEWLKFDEDDLEFSGTPRNADVGTLQIRLTATDRSGATVSDVFALTVTNTNDAPTRANPIADQSATEDQAFSFVVPAGTFADVDVGDTLAYTATKADGSALPAWLTFNAATRTFSGTPANGDVGRLDIKVTARDGSGALVSDELRITVANTNDAPTVASPIVDQSATEDQAFSFEVPRSTFADVDAGDRLSVTATLADGSDLPEWLKFDEDDLEFSGTPRNADVGTLQIRLTATDRSGATVSDVFALTVTNTNDAPTRANPIADQSATEDQAFSFVVPANAFADVDAPYGDTLAYSATKADGSALPTWLTFNAATRTFSGTPANGDVGHFDVKVTARDVSGEQVFDEFRITVANTNDAPTLANSIADQAATEDQIFTFVVPANTFADIDAPYGDTLTYTATKADGTALPSWLTFNAVTRTFSGTPANGDVGFFDVKVTATDGSGMLVTDDFRLTVANTDDAPTLANPLADQSATEDQAFTFVVPADTFADVDVGDTLTCTATQADGAALPSWLTFDATTRTFSGTPANGDVGYYDLKVTATDASGVQVADEFRITVANTNDAPTLANPIADQTATEDQAFSFVVPVNTFADGDERYGDALTYAATKADGTALPSWLSFNATTRTFSGTPVNDDVGHVDVKVTARDISGGQVFDEFRLTVVNTDDAPTLANPIADQSATEDQAFAFVVPANTFADVDVGDTLTYSATKADGTALPTWLSFNAATRTFSGTPANDDVGQFEVKVTATDGSGVSVSDGFRITVANTNDAPTLAQSIADQGATEDQAFSFVVPADTFADVDVGDTLTYTAGLAGGADLPAWLTFNAATRTFTGTPANGDVGPLDITVSATDGSTTSASDTFRLTVANTNDAPTRANPIADQTATEDQAFSFVVPVNTFADVDVGDTLAYSATKTDGSALPAWLTFNATTRAFSGTPVNGDVGQFSVKVTATDGSGVSVSDEFRLTVTNTNDAPMVASPIADQSATEDQAFSFEVPRSTIADVDAGDRLSVTATLADGSSLPEWLKFDADDLEFSGTPRNADVGTLQIRLTATDRSGATVSDVFALTVTNTNDAPTRANPIADQSATEDQAFSFVVPAGAFADVDVGDTLAYSATKVDGTALPAWLTFNAATRTFSGTPANGDLGFFDVKVTATDISGEPVSDTFRITVSNTNDVPTLANQIADQSATEDQAFSFVVSTNTFADVDAPYGDTLTYAATKADGTALPAWLTFNAATRTFSGTPANGDVGAVDIIVTATDGSSASASDTFRLTVANTNDAPTLANPIADQGATEDQAFSLVVPANAFVDGDIPYGDALTYTATKADGTALPSWLTFNAATRTFGGTPANGDVGFFDVMVTATDISGEPVSDTFRITVANTNDAPELVQPVDEQSATEDAAFTFTVPGGTFRDPDTADTLVLSASRADGSALPDWLRFDARTGAFTGTPANADVGSLALRVVATDPSGARALAPFTLKVLNTNDAPQLALAPVTVDDGGSTALAITASDIDNATSGLRFQVEAIKGGRIESTRAPGTALSAFSAEQWQSGELRFVHAGDGAAAGFDLVVSDGAATARVSATVTVRPVVRVPVEVLPAAPAAPPAPAPAPVTLSPIAPSAPAAPAAASPTPAPVAAPAAPAVEAPPPQASSPAPAAFTVAAPAPAPAPAPSPAPAPAGDSRSTAAQAASTQAPPGSAGTSAASGDGSAGAGGGTGASGSGTSSGAPAGAAAAGLAGAPAAADRPATPEAGGTAGAPGGSKDGASTPAAEARRVVAQAALDLSERVPAAAAALNALVRWIGGNPVPEAAIENMAQPTLSWAPIAQISLERGSFESTLGSSDSRHTQVQLEQTYRQVKQDVAGESLEDQGVVASSVVISTGFSVGYVLWLARGGALLASIASGIPAWMTVDPLPVLSRYRAANGGEDDAEDSPDPADKDGMPGKRRDQVENMFGKSAERATVPDRQP
ncbi:MAG: putative Ig domain-containing protein [Rubrivivax sp.]